MSQTHQTDADQPLRAVLTALSAELSLAAVSCGRLDDALGQILEATPPEGRMQVMQELHAVDLLAQHITAITDFTAGLARVATADAALRVDDALSRITLGAVADRLKAAIAAADA